MISAYLDILPCILSISGMHSLPSSFIRSLTGDYAHPACTATTDDADAFGQTAAGRFVVEP
jgi:hypothetical protein